jgi:hypothetical protein
MTMMPTPPMPAPAEPQKPPLTAAEVKKKWTECVDDMLDLRRSYWLNHSYFLGEQWIKWDDTSASVNLIDFTTESEAETRVTVNKIKPRTLSLLARLIRVPLAFEPRPHGIDQESIRKAAMERQVLEVEAQRADWEQIRADNILNELLGAVSAIAVEPDWEYEPEPVYLMETSETMQVPSRPAVLLTALSPAEFGLEPGTRKQKDATWWIRCTTLTPEQCQERYDLKDPPTPDIGASTTSVMHRSLLQARRGAGLRLDARACMVYVYYERPTKRGPGCVIHVVGNEVVQNSPWPFPFKDHLNVAIGVQTPMGSTWKGETILNDARQLQRNYNKAFTSINRHIGKADNARLILPQGSIITEDDELTGDVGEVIRTEPNAGDPHWMLAPQIPRWLREHIDKIEAELDDLFSTHAVSRGEAPGDRNSGLALSILAEKDETPLGPMATNQQRQWQLIAEMVLATMKHLMNQVDPIREAFGQPPMQVSDVQMNTQGVAEDVTWTAADLPDHPVVHVPLESVMPRSQAAIMDAMIRLAQSFPRMFEDMNPGQLAAVLRTPDTTAFASIKDAQGQQATWENTRMVIGVGDEEVIVDDWHDHAKHIAVHNELRSGPAYRMAPPEVQDFIDLHIETHAQLKAELEMEAMRAQMPLMPPPPMGGEGPPPPGDEVAA